jgi:hypothetical protein
MSILKRGINTMLIALFLFPVYGFTQNDLKEKTQRILNDKTIEDPYKRFKTACDTIGTYYKLSYEEGMPLLNDMFLPFAEKKIKDSRKRNMAKSCIYSDMVSVYEKRGEEGDYEHIVNVLFLV